MSRTLSILFIVIALTFLFVVGAGYSSSPKYANSTFVDTGYSPLLVWGVLTNLSDVGDKKSDVASVDILDEYGKLIAWKENLKNGGYRSYRMLERMEGKRLVIELTDSSYGLTGVWTFDITNTVTGSQVVITEDSELKNIWIRGVRYVFGRDHDLLVWTKYIKVGLTDKLLTTP